jgi:N-acetylglucosamine-6-phosphate deacetylase
MSPEYDDASDFIARAVAAGTLIAIGHTNANSHQIRSAVNAGARLSTHLGNGAHGHIRRHPNYIWDQLAEDRLTASVIADGHHLPPEVLQVFLRAKTTRRLILVSDITGMAGLPPGRYESCSLGAVEVLDDGRLVIAGQRQLLAGAALPITAGIANMLKSADVSLAEAVDMASVRPAELIGITPPQLKAGAAADLLLFHLPGADGTEPVGRLTVAATLQAGELVHGTLEA